MARKYWPLMALLVVLSHASFGRSQAPPAPSAPRPAAYLLPPFGEEPTVEPIVNPILDDSPVAGPGWFTNVDLLLIRPHIGGQLVGSPNQGVDTLTLTTMGPLGTIVSPTFGLGYRLPEQRGEWSLQYRFEIAERNGMPANVPDATGQRDRLNLNQVDLDWGGWHPFALDPGWDLRFNAGVRILTVYYDSERNFGPAGNAAGMLDEHASNNYLGVGPEAGLALSRALLGGLNLFGRINGADVFGNVRQAFAETTLGGGGPVGVSDFFKYQASAPILTLQAGLAYSPPGWNYSRFLAGYVWEEYWQIGRLNDSTGSLLNRGAYFRVEINY